MKAILLAAGEGSRLRPFTVSKPKPMVRVANKPIAQYGVEALVENGVKDITLVVGYQRTKVQSYFGDGSRFGARITYAFQEALRGTAAALATVPNPPERFLLLGADNVVDASLIKEVLDAPGEAAVAVHRAEDPTRYGVVTLDGDRVAGIQEKPPVAASEWVSTGVYRVGPRFHEAAARLSAQPGRSADVGLPEVLQRRIGEGLAVTAVRTEALWADAVYPWDLLRIHGRVLRASPPPRFEAPGVAADASALVGRDATIHPGTILGTGTCIGNHVEIGPNCVLENVVVYDDVQIGAGAILKNTVVGEGTRLGPRVTAISDVCDVKTADAWHHLPDFGAVIGEDARVGGAVTLLPGTVLGNRAQVGHGRTVRGTIQDQAVVQ